jgi:predicted RNase H-like nuclease (RuvC/YqgF family)
LKEEPSIDGIRRFSFDAGLSRINFLELIEYFDSRFEFLRNKASELREAISTESEQLQERKRNFTFLKERTEKAEGDAERVNELMHQHSRLKETFREQSATIRALQDRVEMLEIRRIPTATGPIVLPTLDTLPTSSDYFGDVFVQKVFPGIDR